MPGRRLPFNRLAGIAAWTAASVTWGTAAVALANHAPAPASIEPPNDVPAPASAPMEELALPQVPTMPESGLLVLRYVPAERPEPEVVVRTVVVSGGSTSSGTAPSRTTPQPTKETSSGS